MLPQAMDFREESKALYQLLKPLNDEDLSRVTQFKGWTINHVIGHLHMWNRAADLSLRDADEFAAFRERVTESIMQGRTLRQFEEMWLDGIEGRKLVERWHDFFIEMSGRFAASDPKARLQWIGPEMSVRSSITARLMETWAHGQEVYDELGVERQDADRIRNIAVLGMNTFAWTFANRGLEVPAGVPCVRLTAPSGEIWVWNEQNDRDSIEGSATEFCQVAAQTRNIADTKLKVKGDVATRWMANAQCFAGPATTPPAPGMRFCRKRAAAG